MAQRRQWCRQRRSSPARVMQKRAGNRGSCWRRCTACRLTPMMIASGAIRLKQAHCTTRLARETRGIDDVAIACWNVPSCLGMFDLQVQCAGTVQKRQLTLASVGHSCRQHRQLSSRHSRPHIQRNVMTYLSSAALLLLMKTTRTAQQQHSRHMGPRTAQCSRQHRQPAANCRHTRSHSQAAKTPGARSDTTWSSGQQARARAVPAAPTRSCDL